jgi:hypothetical protein
MENLPDNSHIISPDGSALNFHMARDIRFFFRNLIKGLPNYEEKSRVFSFKPGDLSKITIEMFKKMKVTRI